MTEIKTVKEFGDALLFQYPIPVSWAVQQYACLITTIESQKEEIEQLQIDRNDWKDEYMSLKRRFETLDKSALETLELLNEPNSELESLKAIAELAVNGLKWYADKNNWGTIEDYGADVSDGGELAKTTLSEIERLSHDPIS